MRKTTMIVTLAAVAALASAPASQAFPDYLTRSFLDVGVGADFGDGAGLYDPGAPTTGASAPVYCVALLQYYNGLSPASFYYTPPNRYWPGVAAGVVNGDNANETLPAGVDDPTDCLTLLQPDDGYVWVDRLQADAGVAFIVADLLNLTTQVVNLALTTMTVEMCTAGPPEPLASPSTPPVAGLDLNPLVPLTAFMAADVSCPTTSVVDALYPGCATFTLTTTGGSVTGDQPVFLSDAGCNSLQGQPAGDFTAERCVNTVVFDTVSGVSGAESDSDFFVVGKDLSLLDWASQTPPGLVGMFPNVSNLQSTLTC